ncbi:MAG: hypothetical protein O3A00_25450, partial [Planctomycetota bacterium]|nr:hypothetical protein [Planctomycetota bacterium]
DGTLSIDFDADADGGVTDTATNVSTADFTIGAAYTIDKTLPTVASIVSANSNPTNAASVDFTVTFSESVTGVGTGDFVVDQTGVTGASVTGISGSGTTYTVTVGTGSNSGTLSIDFDADANGGATDGVGNVTTADFTTGEAYTIDKTLPTVASIIRVDANPTNAASVNFTVTFSESVTGVGTGDFVVDQSGVTGASVTGISGSGATYTLTVATGSNDGTLSIDFDADADGGATDGVGIVSTADFTTGEDYTIDKTLPSVASIVRADANPTNAASVDFTVTFSEAVTGAGTGDFVVDQSGVTGASVTGISGSGTTYTVTVNTGSNDGTLSIDFDADADGGVTDTATNVSTADFTVGASYTIDKTLPTVVSIVRADASPTNSASVNFTVTFSESVTGVGTGDFVIDQSGVTGASVTGVSGSGTTYTVTVNSGSNDGTLSIDFDADATGGASDTAGNVTTADFTVGETYTIDKTIPTADIVDVTPDPRYALVGTVTINFSENVSGFVLGDLSLTRDNGAVNIGGLTLATVTAQQYTIDLSSVTNQNGADLLTLTAGANIQDNAGNSLAIDATDAFAIDINDPPAFTSTATPSVAENSTVVITVAVNDPDLPAQTITFTKVGGADAALFAINSSSGALTFITAPI